MYLKSLHIKDLKLIGDLSLEFTRGGEIRRWTVIVGRNGRGKTAILQAIALAAAGEIHANDLGKSIVQAFPTRRDGDEEAPATSIEATFRLEPLLSRGRHRRKREYPTTLGPTPMPGEGPVELRSTVSIRPGYHRFDVESGFAEPLASSVVDPLGDARALGLPYWFVAAYGVARHLRFSEGRPTSPPSRSELHLERMRSIFDPDAKLRAIGFADMFDANRAKLFARFLQALTTRTAELLPELAGIELRGKGGVTRPEDLLERDRIVQALPGGTRHKLPATWLSHGYQSSLSWLSDLIGHALIEDSAFDGARNAAPEELQGLVLVDELDLHLHPSWQRTFVRALRDTFPGLQFIVTTHSPLLLSALRPDEVVLLELDAHDRIVQREPNSSR